ncbi:MAG: EVE domain-containing protein [Bacteroidota bacterium]
MPWLIKSDPEEYGWNELLKEKSVSWDGVRNYAARNHLRAMKKGDDVLFYHSGKESAVVATAKVLKEFYKDPTAEDETWSSVEISAGHPFKKTVPLSLIKTEKKLKDMLLIKISRLSVMPVTQEEFERILEMSN